MQSLFHYEWTLGDNNLFVPYHGKKVFSCFACGGGSTMGYKLAGYDVIGCNEIDPRMVEIYKKNHHPKFVLQCDIRDMVRGNVEIPEELYHLDILDGSPPCTSFSMSGVRERDWGKKKKFHEGQVEQTLDDLFFEFIALGKKLQPKIIVAENVKGLIQGKAKKYTNKIFDLFYDAGYQPYLFLLKAEDIGVPQKRPRVFFIAIRNDIEKPIIMNFNIKPIPFSVISDETDKKTNLPPQMLKDWPKTKEGDGVGKFKSKRKVKWNEPCYTLNSRPGISHCHYKRYLNKTEVMRASSWPMNFDFGKFDKKPEYICGMSVPPVMMANIALEIYNQILKNLK